MIWINITIAIPEVKCNLMYYDLFLTFYYIVMVVVLEYRLLDATYEFVDLCMQKHYFLVIVVSDLPSLSHVVY